MNSILAVNQWTLFVIIFVSIFIVLGLAEFIRNYFKRPPESTRKFVHIFIGLIILNSIQKSPAPAREISNKEKFKITTNNY